MKKFFVAAVTATLLALNLQAAPPASASTGCDSYETAVVNAIKTASFLSTITNAAANWRSCLSGYADSRNSYSSYFYTAGGIYYSIMTAALTYSQPTRVWGLKAAADYRMSLMGEESSINVRTGVADCDSAYSSVMGVALSAGDIGLGAKAQDAIQDCRLIRMNPVAEVDWSYSGLLGVGTNLRGYSGTWPYGVSLSYQWFRGASAISGATNSDYVVQANDVGSQLRLRVTGSRSGLTSVSRFSGYTDTVLLPLTLAPTPTLSGTSRVGSVLTANAGTWDSGVTLSYQWLRDGSPIDIATSSTYTLTNFDANKAISVRVTGSKSGFQTTSKVSSATNILGLDMTLTPTPTVTGTKGFGGTLTAVPGTWDSGVAFSYQWLRDGLEIPGATSSTYVTEGLDVDKQLSVRVTGTKLGFTNTSKVSAGNLILPAKFTGATLKPWLAVFGGSAAVGRTAQAALFVEQGAEFSYRWFRNGTLIPSITGNQYVFKPEDFDTTFTVEVTAKKLGYTTLVEMTEGVKVGAAVQTLTPTPTITGTAKVGQTLTAVPGTWGADIGLSYQWLRQGVAIPGATSSTYKTTGDDYLQNISVEVTGAARGYDTVTKVSATTNIAQGTFGNTLSPALYAPFRVGKKLTCFGNEDTWESGVSFTYNWLLGGATFGAPQVSTYTPTVSDLGKSISCSVTGAKPGYASVTKTSSAGTILIGQFDRNPTITGDLKAGSVLSIGTSIWPDDATMSIQWYRNWPTSISAIPGATSSTYKLTAADAGRNVWATIALSAPGFDSVTSSTSGGLITTQTVYVMPLGDSNPALISGAKRVGSKITIQPGQWDAGTTTTITVLAWNGSVAATGTCSGSTNCTWVGPQVDSEGKFTPTALDLNYSLTITVNGTFDGLTASAISYMPIAKGVFDTALLPKITGTFRSGNTVSVDFSGFDPSATVTYQWGWEIMSNNAGAVFGRQLDATGTSFLLGRAGKVALEVVISRPGFETLTYLYPFQTVLLPEQTNIPKPVITGLNRVGSNLGVNFGTGAIGTSLKSIIWYRNGVKIAEGVKNLTSKVSELGAEITVSAVLSKAGFEDALVTSAAITMLPGIMGAGTPSITGTPRVGATLTARTSAWATGAVISYQWLLDGKAIKGATARTYKLLSSQKGKRISLTITQKATGYSTATKTSAAIKVG